GLAATGAPGPSSTTRYEYFNPVFNQDHRGEYGLRGFEAVTTHSPAGSATREVYGYDQLWAGLPERVEILANGADPDHPHRITRTEWSEHTLFGGALRTYHPARTLTHFCRSGETAAACEENGAFVHVPRTVRGYASAGHTPPLR